jgi:hypothetical protein
MIANMLVMILLLDEPGRVLLDVVEAMGFVTNPFIAFIMRISKGNE